MERASDVTWSFLDLHLLPALPLAWLPPWQRHSPQVSWQPIQTSVFLQIEAARPIYGYVQSPNFTPATSSPPSRFITLPARLLAFFFFFFFKYTIAEMKATSKLRPPHPSAERPLQGVRGSFYQLIARMPTLHHQMFHISPVLRCFRKCAKMRTLRAKGLSSVLYTARHHYMT